MTPTVTALAAPATNQTGLTAVMYTAADFNLVKQVTRPNNGGTVFTYSVTGFSDDDLKIEVVQQKPSGSGKRIHVVSIGIFQRFMWSDSIKGDSSEWLETRLTMRIPKREFGQIDPTDIAKSLTAVLGCFIPANSSGAASEVVIGKLMTGAGLTSS